MADTEDGLPIADVGEWATEKHERLRRYVDISRGVRAGFVVRGGAGATYIDLFCGPGKAQIRDTGEIIDGSPLVAFKSAGAGGAPFSMLHVSDIAEAISDAAATRLRQLGAPVTAYHGPAAAVAGEFIARLNPYALHFAFLDPFNLEDLPFTVIETLARLRRMDMLIHVSVQDLQRNLRRYIESSESPLDVFAPGWRGAIDAKQSDKTVRRRIREHWLNRVRGLDMRPSQGIEIVRGSKEQPLYWLVFVARHERAHEFWEKIRDVGRQRRLL